MSTALKEQLVKQCETYVESKLHTVQTAVKELEAALKLETRCSMGDKYETDRAMLHLEFEKIAGQSEGFKKLRKTLRAIPVGKTYKAVTFGSVVKTSVANYFIAIPAGEIMVEEETYFAIGASAPIARILAGKAAGEVVTFNDQEFTIYQTF